MVKNSRCCFSTYSCIMVICDYDQNIPVSFFSLNYKSVCLQYQPDQAVYVVLERVQYSVYLRRYAVPTGRYSVRKNPVISYADINFHYKKVQFSSRHTTNVTIKFKKIYNVRVFASLALFVVISAFRSKTLLFWSIKTRKSNKETHQS